MKYHIISNVFLETSCRMLRGKALDVDHILDHYVGGGGRWQWLTLITLLPTAWAGAYPLFMHIFAAYEPTHRCFVPVCDMDLSGKYLI